MSDMPVEQLPIYAKFVESVKKNDVQKTAELLHEHPFLSHNLEKVMPETTRTPYLFCTLNPGMTELAEVLVVFGATLNNEKLASQEITPYQEMPLTQLPPPSSDSPEIKLYSLLEKSLAERKQEVIKKYHLDTIQKLYILTGMRPFFCNRTLHRNGTQGSHLRLMMPHLQKIRVEVLLNLFNIPFNDGFGTATHSYIAILPANYDAINVYLNNSNVPTSIPSDIKIPNFSIDDLPSENKIALFDILFSTKFLIGLEERNNHQYDLNKIMLHLAKFNMKNSFCFEYLEEQGHEFKHQPLVEKVAEKPAQILHFSPHSPLQKNKASFSAEPTNPDNNEKELNGENPSISPSLKSAVNTKK